MVISHKYKYIYVESPMTGSTAIANELLLNYEGESILRKHALLHELKNVNSLYQNYYIFTNIRNPLDKIVSVYLKTKNDHNHKFTRNEYYGPLGLLFFLRMHLRHQRTVRQASFYGFLKSFPVYDEQSRLYVKRCNKLIRFESLTDDFATVIRDLGLELVRHVPKRNETAGKVGYESFYKSTRVRKVAIAKLGPFMRTSTYNFPTWWNAPEPSTFGLARFYLFKAMRLFSWRLLRPMIASRAKMFQ